MRKFLLPLLFVLSMASFLNGYAESIVLQKAGGIVWHYRQVISGELRGFEAQTLTVHHNDTAYSIDLSGATQFSFPVILKEAENFIWIEATRRDSPVFSDTVHYTLGYKPVPIVTPKAVVEDDRVLLRAEVLENPYHRPLKYVWSSGPGNPASFEIVNKNDSAASVSIPDVAGRYYINLLVIAGSDSARYQTEVIRNAKGLHAFDIDRDYPFWMSDAVIYEITPYSFVKNGKFGDIKAKLPELKELGVNTIWLQPVYKSSYKGQGYDVVDYLSVNPELGTAADLHELIAAAKALEMRVLFDIVLNHTSIQHPYAREAAAFEKKSHYYEYYQRKNDGMPYSSLYKYDPPGFINYFWRDLVNLNYQNEEVQRWMLEVCKYWVREFDIDGYRLDAIWGVNARMPSFARRLRTELKSLKPDLLLLAEDKGYDQDVYRLGFDAAYDWTMDTLWVSQWSWQYEYDEKKNLTFFNHPDVERRDDLLEEVLFEEGGSNEFRLLRFLENNDHHRFIAEHESERTKMAAALIFSLPGIPMLYNGQEIGFTGHPYSTENIFHRDSSIEHYNQDLFRYYQTLIQLRKKHPALKDTTFSALSATPDGSIVAFRRWNSEENFVVVLNMGDQPAEVTVDLKNLLPEHENSGKLLLRDVLSSETYRIRRKQYPKVNIPMGGFSAKWLLLEPK